MTLLLALLSPADTNFASVPTLILYIKRATSRHFTNLGQLHENLRTLETLGKPVVAAMNGSALGGGYISRSHVTTESPSTNQVRNLVSPKSHLVSFRAVEAASVYLASSGIQPALEVIAQGQMLRPSKALKKKLIDELAEDQDQLLEKAHAWIKAHPKNIKQRDERGFAFPGGVQPEIEMGRQLFAGGAAMLLKKTSGAYRAPEAAIQAVYEGCHLDFDTALKVEGKILCSPGCERPK